MDHQHFDLNKEGRDFVVGDLHGEFEQLMSGMRAIKFDPRVDRMFSVGDLIDRGPDSLKCLGFTTDAYFHPVLGNHEAMMIEAIQGDPRAMRNWQRNGGTWGLKVLDNPEFKRALAFVKANTPIALTVEIKGGTVGICHAEPPRASWQDNPDWKDAQEPSHESWERMLWDRVKAETNDKTHTKNVTFTVHGHTPAEQVTLLGNAFFIDTGACFKGGHLTVVDLADLKETFDAALVIERLHPSETTEDNWHNEGGPV